MDIGVLRELINDCGIIGRQQSAMLNLVQVDGGPECAEILLEGCFGGPECPSAHPGDRDRTDDPDDEDHDNKLDERECTRPRKISKTHLCVIG